MTFVGAVIGLPVGGLVSYGESRLLGAEGAQQAMMVFYGVVCGTISGALSVAKSVAKNGKNGNNRVKGGVIGGVIGGIVGGSFAYLAAERYKKINNIIA
jgi:hypothetical protein